MRRQSQKQLLLKCYANICKKGWVRVRSPAGNTDTVIIIARKEDDLCTKTLPIIWCD